MEIPLEKLEAILPNDAVILGREFYVAVSSPRTISEADESSIIWVSADKSNVEEILRTTRAKVAVISKSAISEKILTIDKCFLSVSNPRLTYLRILQKFFQPPPLRGVHATAIIHPDAQIDADVYIGPYSVLGKCKIGRGVHIDSFCKIGDGTQIGSSVIIHSGVIIGTDGFGYSKNDRNELEKFPHFGGVVIEDDVEIGANTCIDRGTLGNTHIKRGAKIDNLVHIAHNVIVGEAAAIIAHSMIGGSVEIKDRAWIAPSACIRDGLSIGARSVVGLGALVVKSVPDDEVWAGFPAKKLRDA